MLPVLGLALVLALGGLAWWWLGAAPAEVAPDGGGATAGVTHDGDAGGLDRDAAHPDALPSGARSTVESLRAPAARSPEPHDATAAAPDATRERVTLVGRLVDAAGRPAEGARVRFLAGGLETLAASVARSELSRRADEPSAAGALALEAPAATAGADGRFALTIDVPERGERDEDMAEVSWMFAASAQLAATHRGLATTTRPCPPLRPGTVDVGTIVMEAGAWIHGVAVDARGRPVAGAWVSAVPDAEGKDGLGAIFDQLVGPSAMLAQVESREDGGFEVGGLRPGRARLVLATPGMRPGHRADVALRPYEGTDVGRVVLEDGEAIAGVVTDAQGRPVPGARLEMDVQVAADEDPFALPVVMLAHLTPRATADAEGRFRLAGLVPGAHEVRAEHEGYLDAALDEVPTGTTDLHVVLERAAELAVLVVSDGDGDPVRDARVVAQRIDADGTIGDTLDVRPPESPGAPHRVVGAGRDGAVLQVRAPGFAATRVTTTQLVAAGGGVLVLSLVPESVVYGTVVDEDGAPVADAEVRLLPADDDDGPFGGGSRGRITFGRSAVARADRSGTVLASGEPADGPRLPPDAVRTDADGAYALSGVGAGAWRLRASAPTYSDARVDLGDIEEGSRHGPVDVTLASAGRIAGTVLETDGAPVADALVVVAPGDVADLPDLLSDGMGSLAAAGSLSGSLEERMANLRRATTAADGSFAVDGLPPGPYAVTMRPPGMSMANLLAFTGLDTGSGGAADARRAVEVVAGEETRVDFVRPARAVIHGRVVAGGAPAAGAQVRLLDRTKLMGIELPIAARSATTGRDGAYRFEDVEPGAYGVAATVAQAALEKRVDVEAASGRTVRADLVFGTGRVTGRVVDRGTGAGLPGVPVSIAAAGDAGGGLLGGLFGDSVAFNVTVDVDGNRQERRAEEALGSGVRTGEDGAFELRFLDPGRYTVSTEAGEWTAATSEPFDLPDGASHEGVRLEVERAATLTGRVTLAGSGAPVTGQQVRVAGADGRSESTRTDGDGAWTLAGLAPGEYAVTLPGDGMFASPKAKATVTLAAGERRVLDLTVPTD